MNNILKIAAITGAIYLVCFWSVSVLLSLALPHETLGQWLGFVPAPTPPLWFYFLLWTFNILCIPGSSFVGHLSGMEFTIGCSLVNGIIWGMSLSFLTNFIRRKFPNRVPQKS
jgi:hypothetical protein